MLTGIVNDESLYIDTQEVCIGAETWMPELVRHTEECVENRWAVSP